MRLRESLVVLLLLLTGAAQAQMDMNLPNDTAIRKGVLPNGLTYYIRHNNWPEHRANFYIAQKVGSLQEEENQRGLAHFLEHMCFNGTDHFKGNDLIEWCRSKGIAFGADLNAYTSIDQTVYNINNVPTKSQSTLDSCLIILYDWANGLTLDPKEIDKERGVIHEEWRLRSSAMQRMYERALPKLYPGSKYGLRMPIGLMSVVDNFKPKELRDYYEKWYNPENQGIIVVGDVDVNHTEEMIKKLFGPIKAQANAGKVVSVDVPDNDKPIVVVEKDKEQKANIIEVCFKYEPTPDSLHTTVMYTIGEYVKSAMVSMLNDRLNEMAQKKDCPFVGASIGDGIYLLSKTKNAITLEVIPKDGKTYEALSAVVKEARRAAVFGFTATEYERFKENVLSSNEKRYSNRDKRTNNSFYSEMLANFLYNDAMPSIDFSYNFTKQLVPNVPLESINQVAKKLISQTDSNMVIMSFNTEKDGATYPTEQLLLDAVHKGRSADIQPYVDNVKNEPLLKQLPKPGKIVKETTNKLFGYKELTLSNGIKVILKPTDFKKDEVSMSAECPGGASLYGLKDYANVKMFNSFIGYSGLGDFTSTELQKALAGKIANADLSMSTLYNNVTGSSTPKDMETMLQLAYLYFTDIKKDTASINSLMNNYEIALKNRELDPMSAYNDSLSATLYSRNPWARSIKLSDLKDVDYDRILQMAKEITASPASYTFTFIGNFQEDSIKPLICRYIASLPAKKNSHKGHRIYFMAKGKVDNHFTRKMETPKAIDVMVWHNDGMKFTQENALKAAIAGKILDMVFLQKIREDASAAYSVGVSGSISHYPDGSTEVTIEAQCPMKPEKADIARSIMKQQIDSLTLYCDPVMLQKVKGVMAKQHDTSLKTNGYWSGIIDIYRKYGLDLHSNYTKILDSITPQDICDFMKEFLKQGNRVDVSMMPLTEKK